MLKITFKFEQKYFTSPNFLFPSPVPPASYQMTAGRIAKELWWTSQEISSVDIIIPSWFSMLIYHIGDEQ
jgi:hypothetical protein